MYATTNRRLTQAPPQAECDKSHLQRACVCVCVYDMANESVCMERVGWVQDQPVCQGHGELAGLDPRSSTHPASLQLGVR